MLSNQTARGYWGWEYFDQGYFGVSEEAINCTATAITAEIFDAILQDPPTEIGYQPSIKIGGVATDNVLRVEVSGNRDYSTTCEVTVAGIVAPAIDTAVEVNLAIELAGGSADYQLFYGYVTGVEPSFQDNKTKIQASIGSPYYAYWTNTQYVVFQAFNNPLLAFTVGTDGVVRAEKQAPTDPIGSMKLVQVVESTDSEGNAILTATTRVTVASTVYPDGRTIEDSWPTTESADAVTITNWGNAATRVVTAANFGTVVIVASLLPMVSVGQGFQLDSMAAITADKLRIESYKHVLEASGFTTELRGVLAWP